MDPIEEIRSRVAIEELVGQHTQLKKAGRNLKGLCPFHNEKTPSFMVSPDKGIAYCFGCQKGGDIFKFVELTENVDFKEAVRILAEKAHVPLPAFQRDGSSRRLKVIEMNRAAVAFFETQLERHPDKRSLLLARGLTEDTLKAFHLGYAPDSFTALKDALTAQGFSESDLLEAGLLNQRSMADKNTYDRFRDRLMFPIFDHQDNPVGFGGRIISGEGPKYVNSPDTPAYNKSAVLYGLNWAKESVKQEGRAVVVEGYMDCIALHQAGYRNTVATSGTALTPQQLKLVQRYAPAVAFAFDADSAGQEATRRAIELASGTELRLHIILTPQGKDPDECVRDTPEAWAAAWKKPLAPMDFYFDYIRRQCDLSTLDGKKTMLQFLLPLIRQLSSEMEQGFYLERLALELRTDIRLLWEDLKKIRRAAPSWQQAAPRGESNAPASAKATAGHPALFKREAYLLGFILEYPETYPYAHDNLIDSVPFDPETEKFYKVCKQVYSRQSAVDSASLLAELSPEEFEKLTIYRLLIEERYPDFSPEAAAREVKKLVHHLNRDNLIQAQKDCERLIRSASEAGEKLILLNQYNQILKLKAKLN